MMDAELKKKSETYHLAKKVAGRYGRLALTRAASEAAIAEKKGDQKTQYLWESVIDYIRLSLLQRNPITIS